MDPATKAGCQLAGSAHLTAPFEYLRSTEWGRIYYMPGQKLVLKKKKITELLRRLWFHVILNGRFQHRLWMRATPQRFQVLIQKSASSNKVSCIPFSPSQEICLSSSWADSIFHCPLNICSPSICESYTGHYLCVYGFIEVGTQTENEIQN